ncbi:EP1-like glycoprotein 3 [Hevea brasiliensis]|uniref:EP1-like glycoprotein 3 n=1 Tax=Hevea brasiliensis TaxID=3981 RepID=UPI0025D5FB59|nr:EP1-like glycoprotein 3 [Hevea brasiliensis]
MNYTTVPSNHSKLMGVWPLDGIMLLQLFIILSLPHFQHAQIVYFPAAKVPTSWSINPRTSAYDQIILSNGKPNANYGFACGFYSQNDKRSFYLAIGSAAASIDTSGNQVWTFTDNIAWVANRNRPVGENAELQLLPDGNLVLKDTDGILVWSTDTANKSVAGMKMMDTGNLVLHDGFNNTVWQSFDHPTDKLLPGQKLLAGQKLVASISKTNVSEGDYSVSLTSKGLVAFYDEIMYFSLYFPDFFPEIQTVESIELTVNGTFGVYALTREVVVIMASAQMEGVRALQDLLKIMSRKHKAISDAKRLIQPHVETPYPTHFCPTKTYTISIILLEL